MISGVQSSTSDNAIDYTHTYPPASAAAHTVPVLMRECWESLVDKRMEFDKNVHFMQKCSEVVRLLRGGRIVFCKSGKDRTSMAITLEAASVAANKHGVTEKEAATI